METNCELGMNCESVTYMVMHSLLRSYEGHSKSSKTNSKKKTLNIVTK